MMPGMDPEADAVKCRPITPRPASFVRELGVVLEAARGPVRSLVEVMAGAPVRGSWWSHPKSHRIFAATRGHPRMRGRPRVSLDRWQDHLCPPAVVASLRPGVRPTPVGSPCATARPAYEFGTSHDQRDPFPGLGSGECSRRGTTPVRGSSGSTVDTISRETRRGARRRQVNAMRVPVG
jgi:hypothetical protein